MCEKTWSGLLCAITFLILTLQAVTCLILAFTAQSMVRQAELVEKTARFEASTTQIRNETAALELDTERKRNEYMSALVGR